MSSEIKDTAGKPPMGLLLQCNRACGGIANVMAYGNQKYAPGTWRLVPARLFLDAAVRHLSKIASGEKIDAESGLAHAFHAACNLVYYADLTAGDSNTKTTPDWREGKSHEAR